MTFSLILVDQITSARNEAMHIQPRKPKRCLPVNCATSTLEHASVSNYPGIAASLNECVSPSLASPVAGQATTAPAIGIRSTGDKKPRLRIILVR